MATPESAGIGDPYWYEWFVGLSRAIDLLDPDSGLISVVFQASHVIGIDDVVVKSSTGLTEYIQVKHTRDANTLTFGDLVAQPSRATDDRPEATSASIIRKTAAGWQAQRAREGRAISVTIATNRQLGQRPHLDFPRLDEFWAWLSAAAQTAFAIGDIDVPTQYREGFSKLLEELSNLSPDAALEFLRSLKIEAHWPSLGDLEAQCTTRLAVLLGVSDQEAAQLFTTLAGHLRHWTTSGRHTEEVRAEDVWAALTDVTETVGDHDLPPPAPFFPSRNDFVEHLRAAVLAPGATVVWLVGEPGSGKTSIISACTNAAEPLVDVRFHAYRPITPNTRLLPADSGRLVEVEALWGDLLSQLRTRFFRGKLAQFRVPVRNSFLDAECLRREVLRLAKTVSDETGRPFIIAIDGLDHAARAGARGRPLLDSLPPPNALPEGVRVILAGQPHYSEYPDWLRQNAAQIDVPAVTEADVTDLVATRVADPDFRGLGDDVGAVARAVAEVSAGNCLTTIFAVEELRGLGSAGDAPGRLASRNLGPQLGSYYNQLWTAAVAPLETRSMGASLDFAAVLCITPERLTGALLHALFPARDLGSTEWEAALRQLRPLVVQEREGWRLFVNDVRVFLHGIAASAPDVFRGAASAFADVLLRRPKRDQVVYSAAPVLLDRAGRGSERVAIFTPGWVLGAYRSGIHSSEILRQADDALVHVETATWPDLFALARGLFTYEQLVKSLRWLGCEEDGRQTHVPACMATEGRVPPTTSMQQSDLRRMAEDAVALVAANEHARASALMHRWLAAAPLEQFSVALDDENISLQEKEGLTAIAEAIGQVAAATRTSILASPKEGESSGMALFRAHLSRGAIRQASQLGTAEGWAFVLEKVVTSYFPKDFLDPVRSAVAAGTIESLRPLLAWHDAGNAHLADPVIESWLHVAHVLDAAPAATIDDHVDQGVDQLGARAGELEYSHVLEAWALLAFLRGYLRRNEEPSTVADAVRAGFAAHHDHSSERRATIGPILRAASVAGSWCARIHANELTRPDEVVIPRWFNDMIGALLSVSVRPISVDYRAKDAAAAVFAILSRIAQQDERNRSAWDAVVDAAVNFCGGDYIGPPRNTVLWILRSANRPDIIKAWRHRWCAEKDGKLWNARQEDSRNDILSFFIEANQSLDDEAIETPALRDLDRRTRIGFSGHKEGVIDVPNTWFETLADRSPQVWSSLGIRLLQISETVSRDGDNSFSGEVERAIYKAAASASRNDVLLLVESRRRQAKEQQLPSEELRAFLRAVTGDSSPSLDYADIEAVWAASIGLFVWMERYDQFFIAEMRERLIHAASRSTVLFRPVREDICWQSQVAQPEPESRASSPIPGYETPIPAPPSCLEELRAIWPRESLRSRPWKDFCRLFKESVEGGDRSAVPAFFELLLSQDFSYGFRNNGSTSAAFTMLPILDEAQQRRLLVRSLAAKYDRADCLLLLIAGRSLVDPTQSAAMLGELLDDMSLWVEAYGLRQLAPRTPLITPEMVRPSLIAWATDELVSALDSTSGDEFGAAMRGLGRVLQNTESRRELADALTRRGSPSSNKSVLFVLEALVRRSSDTWPDVRSLVEAARHSPSLQTRLQGWLVERAVASLSEDQAPDFVGPPASETELAILSPPPITTPPERHGYFRTSSVEQSTRSSLQRVERATGRTLLAAEARAEYIRQHVSGTVSLRPPRASRNRTSCRLDPAGEIAIDRVVAQEMQEGAALYGVPMVRIAQALLSGDEPWLATSSAMPMPLSIANDWPGEEWFRRRGDLDIGARDDALRALFERLVNEVVDDEWLVLGAAAKTFGHDVDAVFWHHLAADENTCSNLWDNAWEVPRSFGWSDPEAWTTCTVRTTTGRAHGGFNNIDDSFDIVPAVRLWRSAGWQISVSSPAVWVLEGEPVARFERFATPGDYEGSYRHPYLLRWVGRRANVDRLAELLGCRLVPRTLLGTHIAPR